MSHGENSPDLPTPLGPEHVGRRALTHEEQELLGKLIDLANHVITNRDPSDGGGLIVDPAKLREVTSAKLTYPVRQAWVQFFKDVGWGEARWVADHRDGSWLQLK